VGEAPGFDESYQSTSSANSGPQTAAERLSFWLFSVS